LKIINGKKILKNIADLNSFRDCYEKRSFFIKHGFASIPLKETKINQPLAFK